MLEIGASYVKSSFIVVYSRRKCLALNIYSIMAGSRDLSYLALRIVNRSL
jgi:hypothetical protein